MTTEQPLLLSLEEAAELLGMSSDELLRSRARGLQPGTLGFKDQPGGVLIWKREDLEAPEQQVEEVPEIQAQTTELEENQCDVCGFIAKTPGGLASHKRTHDEEG